MFDCLTTLPHGLRVFVEALLYGLQYILMLALIGYLEKTIGSKEHKAKAEALALDPQIIKGEDYRKFLKDTEQATKKLMGW
jgi:hypothetical protein